MKAMYSKGLLGLLCPVFVMGFVHSPETKDPDPNPLTAATQIPADVIASAGHGEIFDQVGRPIALTDEVTSVILESMIDVLWEFHDHEVTVKDDREQDAAKYEIKKTETNPLEAAKVLLEEKLKEAKAYLDEEEADYKYKKVEAGQLEEAKAFLDENRRSRRYEIRELVAVQTALVGQLLRRSPRDFRSRYVWRHRLIIGRHLQYLVKYHEINRWTVQLELRRFTDWAVYIPSSTDYMDRCRAADIPVPPPWKETGTAWKYHGLLTEKLILGSFDAHVYTWADPHDRGGCIALPRGSGAVGSAAGIICQSASTGKACFWDNIPLGTWDVMGWANKTLDVAQLRDGDTLIGCMSCHQGNNAFNISPDDSTWAKVIRPAMQSNVGATFTTHIENASVPRYIPVSTQASWTNPAANQCIGCHERPSVGFSPPSIMPPNCKTSGTDPAGCY